MFSQSMRKIGEMKVCTKTSKDSRSEDILVEWRISDIFSIDMFPFESDSFEFAAARWVLRVEQNSLSFEVYLVKEGSTKRCYVYYTMALKKTDGTLQFKKEELKTFGKEKRKDLCFCLYKSGMYRRRPEIEPLGIMTIVCSFKSVECFSSSQPASAIKISANSKTVKEPTKSAEASPRTQSENCTEKLSSDLSNVLLSGEDSDLTVRVKGVDFYLHRVIMGARTPVFSAMLRSDMKEKATGVVSVCDCEVEVFRAFVQYVYSGKVNELSTNIAFQLFVIADKYQVDELKSVCLEFIRRSLSVNTFCDVVTLALTYNQNELLGQATDFLSQNMVEIMKTVKWMNFMSENCIQANELLVKAAERSNSK